jgi:hypothetical protein
MSPRAARSASLLLAAVAVLVPAKSAIAHGPCSECISPKLGPAGTIVRINWTAVKVVWNPNRSQDAYGLLQDVYHPDERSEVVFRSERPRKSRFRVPHVTPGKYAIAQYDGSEGGTHYTWAYFTVLATAQRTPARPVDDTGGGNGHDNRLWLWGATAGIVALLLAASARWRWRGPRNSPPPGG